MYLPSKLISKSNLVIFIVFLLILLPLSGAVENLFTYFSKKFLLIGPQTSLKQLNEAKKQNLKLLFQLRQLDYLKDENARLRKALKFRQEKQADLIEANIIAFNPSSWRRLVIIDIGRDKGCRKGLLAINEEGNFIGKIVEVKNNSSSYLMFVNDPEFSLPVFVGEFNSGLLKGSLKGVKVLYVESQEAVHVNDKIWIKIPSLPFPVYVGQIRRAKRDSEGLFWDIDVQLLAKNPLLDKIFIAK